MKWVCSYGRAMSIHEKKPAEYGKDLTLRYPVVFMFDGTKIKLSLDNYACDEEVNIEKVSVLYHDEFHILTFNGSLKAKMDAHERITSDELNINVKKGEEAYISIYLKDFTNLCSSVLAFGPMSSGTYSKGDMTTTKGIDIANLRETPWVYFLQEVDVYTDNACRSILCYGDSITAQSWPDYLNQELLKGDYKLSAIKRAVCGARVLRQYESLTYKHYGLKGENRFTHELEGEGFDTVIILQGINDIIHPVGEDVNPFRPWSDLPTVEELTEGILNHVNAALEKGLKVYVGTLLPIEGWRTYAPFREELRVAFNNWVRSTFENVIDFDALLADPDRPSSFKAEYDKGDHLHPSEEGYKKMALEVLNIMCK